MPPECATTTFDVGPGVLQIALQLVTLGGLFLGASRIQSVVQGQQAALSAKIENLSTRVNGTK